MMTEVRGASNAKAKRELGWQPRHPSWRAGLRGGAGMSESRERCSRSCAPARSRSPTGCSAASREAEDVVQEALLRLHRALDDGRARSSRRAPTSRPWPRGWRSTSCARRGRGARATWASGCPSRSSRDPETRPRPAREIADSLSLAFLVLLETLSPEQRAVLLLHDVFDYGYDEVADDRRQERGQRAPARRPARGATCTSAGRASSRRASSTTRWRERFFAAAKDGDVDALEALLAEDVVLHGDGGGKAPALARMLRGRERVARTFIAWARAGTARGRHLVPHGAS